MTTQHTHKDPISSYLGISFALFLSSFPKKSQSLLRYLQTHNESLSKKLLQAEEQLEHLYGRRKEYYKANARVVEIFASHRHTWQQEEKRLLQQIDDDVEKIASLSAQVEDLEVRVDELQREVSERDELLNFMTNNNNNINNINRDDDDERVNYDYNVNVNVNVKKSSVIGDYYNVDDLGSVYDGHNMFSSSEFSDSAASKFVAERSNSWQVSEQQVAPLSLYVN